MDDEFYIFILKVKEQLQLFWSDKSGELVSDVHNVK